jgi:diguanylate cyclase (GGDEF)-like protein
MLTGATNPDVEAIASLLPCILTVASLRVQEVQHGGRAEREGAGQRRFSVMPYLAVVATQLLLVGALRGTGAGPRMWGVAAGVLLITAAVLTRQLVAFHDNDRLLTDLDSSMLELRRLHEELRHQAGHDALTGLANRSRLAEHLAAMDTGTALSILIIDLDGFKQVNDVHGHHIGDELLVDVAGRLSATTAADELAVRLGGDEFAVLLPGLSATAAQQRAARLTAALSEPYPLAGTVVTVGASIGVATGSPADADALLRHADADMYRHKHPAPAAR